MVLCEAFQNVVLNHFVVNDILEDKQKSYHFKYNNVLELVFANR